MTFIRSSIFVVICFSFVLLSAPAPGANAYGDQVRALIDNSRKDDPQLKALSNALAHYITGAIYDNFGDPETAVSEYEKALKNKNDISEIHVRLGSDFLLLGKLDEATKGSKAVQRVKVEPSVLQGSPERLDHRIGKRDLDLSQDARQVLAVE